MDYKKFGIRLLEIVLLLIGLQILNAGLIALAPSMGYMGESSATILQNLHWIGNITFGAIIYVLTKQTKKVSASIALLSIMLPVFGGLFHLLTLAVNPTHK